MRAAAVAALCLVLSSALAGAAALEPTADKHQKRIGAAALSAPQQLQVTTTTSDSRPPLLHSSDGRQVMNGGLAALQHCSIA